MLGLRKCLLKYTILQTGDYISWISFLNYSAQHNIEMKKHSVNNNNINNNMNVSIVSNWKQQHKLQNTKNENKKHKKQKKEQKKNARSHVKLSSSKTIMTTKINMKHDMGTTGPI